MTEDAEHRLVAWLSSHPGSWSSSDLAAALGVTDRSVRNYVARLNLAASEPVVVRGERGYRLRESDATAVLPARGRGSVGRTPALLRSILMASSPLSIYSLAEELGVSESTVEKHLRRLAEAARDQNVELVREGEFVRAIGSEVDKRRWMRAALGSGANRGQLLTTAELIAAFPGYDILDIRASAERVLVANGLYANDYTLNPLVLDLVIALDRVGEGHTIDGATHAVTLPEDSRMGAAATTLLAKLTHDYGVQFTAIETSFVAMLIASKTTLLRGATDSDVVLDHVGSELTSLVRRILIQLEDAYLVEVTDDAFVAGLALHIHHLLLRAAMGRSQANPLAAAIRAGHPLVHELAIYFSRELEQATGVRVDSEEVGFIAFHLGAALERRRGGRDKISISIVAPRYNNVAEQVATRIAIELGELVEIVQVLESSEPTAADLVGDLVLSPSPIAGIHPSRLVCISPLVSSADVRVVQALVLAMNRRSAWMRLMTELHELFQDRLFYVAPAIEDRDSLIAMLCEALEREGAVASGFAAQVLEREALASTAFNGIVAVPHTLAMTAARTSIAVASLARPMAWGDSRVRLVLLVAFSAADRHVFRDTFDQLVVALSEPRNVQRLLTRGRTFPEFIAQLSELMQEE